jgi:hypothetical protein
MVFIYISTIKPQCCIKFNREKLRPYVTNQVNRFIYAGSPIFWSIDWMEYRRDLDGTVGNQSPGKTARRPIFIAWLLPLVYLLNRILLLSLPERLSATTHYWFQSFRWTWIIIKEVSDGGKWIQFKGKLLLATIATEFVTIKTVTKVLTCGAETCVGETVRWRLLSTLSGRISYNFYSFSIEWREENHHCSDEKTESEGGWE